LSRRAEKRPGAPLVSARHLRVSAVVSLADFRISKPELEKPAPDFAYAELAVTSNFSFLRGASHPGDFVARAAQLGYAAIGIADRNSLAGIVRAYSAWQ